MPDSPGRRIIILGSGFAGATCAQELEKRLRGRDVEVLLLDAHNYFVFTPLLIEAGTGSLEPRHAVVSIRSFLRRTRFRQAEVLGVDAAARNVRYRIVGESAEIREDYDHLVLALGSVTRRPAVPGLAEHGFDLKGLADSVALRDRAIHMLERAEATPDPEHRAALLRFVVVGGNFSGVELAGEFMAFLQEASRQYRNLQARQCGVTLVEISDRILGALEPDLGEYARRNLEKRGVKVLLRSTVTRLHGDHVDLEDGTRLGTHTVVWCAGIAPPPLVGRLGLPTDDLGYVLCAPDLRVRGRDDIWAIGDCAVNVDPAGDAYPATAQHAVRQGKHLASNLQRLFDGATPRPLRMRGAGTLAALGCRTGVAEVFGVKLTGFAAWFVWRTVYLLKMPGWSRRLRVALDWTADLFFRRDYVSLGIHRVRTQRRALDAENPKPTAVHNPESAAPAADRW